MRLRRILFCLDRLTELLAPFLIATQSAEDYSQAYSGR